MALLSEVVLLNLNDGAYIGQSVELYHRYTRKLSRVHLESYAHHITLLYASTIRQHYTG